MRSSRAYTGFVTHVRRRPKSHRLKYKVFYLLLDLDELPALDAQLSLFGHNRAAPFAFYDVDHGACDGTSPRAWAVAQLAKAGIEIFGGRVLLLCMPRMFGYVFNPLSIYFCYDASDDLRAILYEVRNTFGESHTYVVPVDEDGRAIHRHHFDKAFYVSPFLPMDCTYDMATLPPSERVSVTIAEADTDGPILTAAFSGGAKALTDGFLVASLVRYPLMTIKVIAGIHWEALKLSHKRTPVFRHPPAPKHAVTIVTSPARVPHGRSDTSLPAA